MKTRCLLTLLFAACHLPIHAQTPPTRPAPVISPEVKDDRSVTFRLKAPKAQQVSVRGQWTKEPLALTKGEDGVWFVEADALPTGGVGIQLQRG